MKNSRGERSGICSSKELFTRHGARPDRDILSLIFLSDMFSFEWDLHPLCLSSLPVACCERTISLAPPYMDGCILSLGGTEVGRELSGDGWKRTRRATRQVEMTMKNNFGSNSRGRSSTAGVALAPHDDLFLSAGHVLASVGCVEAT